MHVEAVRRAGLRIQTNAFDEHVPVRASTEPVNRTLLALVKLLESK